MKTTLVIADDHELIRDALSAYAAEVAGLEIVGCVGDAQSAVGLCASHRPNLLLLDIEMPGRDALSAILDVRSVSPDTRVVMLTAFCRDAFIQLALDNGASGYLLKSDSPRSLFEALARVAAGGTAFSKAVAYRMSLTRYGTAGEAAASTRLAELTPREVEVLRYIGLGRDNGQMSREMHLSKRTVERHVARLMDAIAIRDRSGLVRFAYEQGLAV